MKPRQLKNLKDAAAYLGISLSTARSLIARRKLEFFRVTGGGAIRIDKAELDRHLNSVRVRRI